MRILLTNDDGIDAPGIKALFEGLRDLGEVWVVAPSDERSGVSHAFSIHGPLRVDHADWVPGSRGYGVHGTPVDAVKLAIRSLMPEAPDLVVSGINRGENTGVDLLYSGTVAAAMEGAVFGVPSVAISLASKDSGDYSVAARFAADIVVEIFRRGLPPEIMLNVNVPPLPEAQIRGVKVTHQAQSRYVEQVRRIDSPNGGECYWVEYEKILTAEGSGSDIEAIRQNYISVTPIHAKLTVTELLPQIEEWNLSLNSKGISDD